MKGHNGLMENHRFVTPLDETIVRLCRPERFMRLIRRYMLFDGPHKKVARYQQVTTVETLLKRMEERSEEHTSELQSLMRISYAVFCLNKKKQNQQRPKP